MFFEVSKIFAVFTESGLSRYGEIKDTTERIRRLHLRLVLSAADFFDGVGNPVIKIDIFINRQLHN